MKAMAKPQSKMPMLAGLSASSSGLERNPPVTVLLIKSSPMAQPKATNITKSSGTREGTR